MFTYTAVNNFCCELGGKIVVMGSGHMFSDKYIDQENNEKFREVIFEFLKSSGCVKLAHAEHDDVDVSKYYIVQALDNKTFMRFR